jgi:hypothetical protein
VIPMLTSFDLSFERDDEHVAQLGAWLDNISFDPRTGTLAYDVSTLLRRKKTKPGFHSRVGVTLLGLNRRRAPYVPPTTSQVVIQRPTIGSYRVDWCLSWSTDCGKPAADYYCRSQYGNQAGAVDFRIEENIGSVSTPTLTQKGLEVCNQSFCAGFASITCRKPFNPPIQF